MKGGGANPGGQQGRIGFHTGQFSGPSQSYTWSRYVFGLWKNWREIDKSNPRCSCCKARALATLPLYCPTDINVNKVIVHRKLDVLSLMFHIHFTNPMKFPYAQIPLPGIVSLASTPVFLPVIKPVIQPWSHILLYSFCQSEEYKESVKSV